MNYKITKSFPSIDSIKPNTEYGQILLNNVGGINSEMSAISYYFYNHIILKQQNKELSEIMMKISIVEMEHLDILCQLCLQLGIDPRLWDCQNEFLQYWSPSYNIYSKQIECILETAILNEKQSIQTYQNQVCFIHDKIIQDILNHIILDEQLHVQIFEDFLQNIK